MLRDVVSVEAAGNYRLRLRFDDGVEGEIDVAARPVRMRVRAATRSEHVRCRDGRSGPQHDLLAERCRPRRALRDLTGKPIPDLTLRPADARTA